jgi:hypothetical protein
VSPLLLLPLLTGCQKDEATAFPAGLEPLEDNQAPAPQGTDADPWPEQVEVVSGETDDWVYAHARGYVHAPVATVWAALRDPAVIVDRRRVTSYTSTDVDDPDYDFVYDIDHLVEDIVTVEYIVQYRHGVWEGTVDDPSSAAFRWQKTEGSSFVEALEGSGQVEGGVDPDDPDAVTEVQLIEHLTAALSEPEEVAQFLQDVFDNVVSVAHGGEPLDFPAE